MRPPCTCVVHDCFPAQLYSNFFYAARRCDPIDCIQTDSTEAIAHNTAVPHQCAVRTEFPPAFAG